MTPVLQIPRRESRRLEVIRIRTDEETLKEFKIFVIENNFRSYHEAFNWLLKNNYKKKIPL